MKHFILITKVFAVLTLFFLNSSEIFAQVDSIYRVPSGTKIRVRMDTELSSKVASVNDTFVVRIAEAVSNRGVIVLPTGTEIEGRVVAASPASMGGSNGKLDLRFDTIRLEAQATRSIDGVLTTALNAKSQRGLTFLSIAGLTAAGAVFGAVSKVKNGTVIGAAAGAGSGTAIVLLRKGSNVRIKANEVFEIELRKDLTLPVRDF